MQHRRFFIPASIILVLCIAMVVIVLNNSHPVEDTGLVGHVGAYSNSGYMLLIIITSLTFYMIHERRKIHEISRGERRIIKSILDEKQRN